MKKAIKQITLILVSVTIISSILAVILVEIFIYDPPYREFFPGFHYAVGFILMQTILATSSFLNVIRVIRSNHFYSALTFFALPLLLLCVSWEIFYEELEFLFVVEIPFFTLLVLGFLWFRKKNK
jgi:hypothetical protein